MPVISPGEIVAAIRNAGVVGAGGAGFPTHVKLSASVDTIIANGAECEPTLACDRTVLLRDPARVVAGIRIAMGATGAKRAFIAVKRKNEAELTALTDAVSRPGSIGDIGGTGDAGRIGDAGGIEVFWLDDVYPVGDEHVLVHEVTGRYVPEGGLPLEVGVVVSNVATLANVANALDGHPTISRFVTVAGAVAHPLTALFPIGTPVADAIALAGGPAAERYSVIMGGPIMGRLATDTSAVITKLTGGVIVLPVEHPLVRMREDRIEVILRRARSACCQCMSCTETCPRHLLGHRISPHLIMRAMSMAPGSPPDAIATAWLCSECGVCATVGCPVGLAPVRVNQALKQSMAARGIKSPFHRSELAAHPMRQSRRVPSSRLVARAGLASCAEHSGSGFGAVGAASTVGPVGRVSPVDAYPAGRAGRVARPTGATGAAGATEEPREFSPGCVRIPLLQHVGAPAVPRVRPGDTVYRGDLIAEIPEGALGARIHASISGTVSEVGEAITIVSGRGRR